MNLQFLEELRQYLQINQENFLEAVKLDEECISYQMEKEVTPPQQISAKPRFDKRINIKEMPLHTLYNKCSAPIQENSKKAASIQSETDIEEYIRRTKNDESFSSMLLKYIDQTGLSDPEIYKRAGIDRKHFSKIRCDKDYRPKKVTAIALCLALELRLEQVEEMLGLAGYSLSNNDTGDLIVKFCIEKGIYDLIEVNEALVYFGVKAIGVVG